MWESCITTGLLEVKQGDGSNVKNVDQIKCEMYEQENLENKKINNRVQDLKKNKK